MTHFKKSVSKRTQNKIKEFAELVKNDYISELQGHEHGAAGIGDIGNISGVSYDGFVAYQDGGYVIQDYYSIDGDGITEKEGKFRDACGDQALEDYLDDNRLDKGLEYSDLTEDQQADFNEYEADYINPSLLQAEIWIDKEEVFMRLSLNYEDAPYYRSKYNEDLKEITMEEKDFLSCDLKKTAKDLFII